MQPLKKRVESLRKKIERAKEVLHFSALEAELSAIDEQLNEPEIWNNPDYAQSLAKKSASLQQTIQPWQILTVQLNDIIELITLEGDDLLAECQSLEHIKIPDNIARITDRMFMNCSRLKKVELHEKLNSIGERAFFGCSNLDFIIIPDSVQQIGQDAFTGTDDMFIVQCSFGSFAEQYCRKNKIKYQLV